ncbi:esterase/lipase family protein [Corynebacterium callunae]|uniref:esterase/lipase family protein n=1 Tax=Corynebacterium callunae TaxID=1721 RepID=UPI0020004AA9|nr:triacylglycerol lipase [Corynebacterium callunae]MCK2201622.1 triacylglycerol lipase [Corynebacterium callunae]
MSQEHTGMLRRAVDRGLAKVSRNPREDFAEELTQELYDHATNITLPLTARLKPKGFFQDDWRARPTGARPWPIVLIHGSGASKGSWEEMGGELRAKGWAVFAPDFGHRATAPIAESAAQIGAYIDAVLLVTGAAQVVLVGHSQGGVVARYWMRSYGGYMKVRHMVSLSVPNHGTLMGGILHPLTKVRTGEGTMERIMHRMFGPTGFEQLRGHDIIEFLAEGGDLDPGVTYTCVGTHFDPFIQPPEVAFLEVTEDDDPNRVHNIWVEDDNPRAMIRHNDMVRDPRVIEIVRAELDRVARLG